MQNGVWQLIKITVSHSEKGGSSRGIRELLNHESFKEFSQKNPQINFQLQQKAGAHPFLQGEYISGTKKLYCVKNESRKDILEKLFTLRNQWGISRTFKRRIQSSQRSVQGQWTPWTQS